MVRVCVRDVSARACVCARGYMCVCVCACVRACVRACAVVGCGECNLASYNNLWYVCYTLYIYTFRFRKSMERD